MCEGRSLSPSDCELLGTSLSSNRDICDAAARGAEFGSQVVIVAMAALSTVQDVQAS